MAGHYAWESAGGFNAGLGASDLDVGFSPGDGSLPALPAEGGANPKATDYVSLVDLLKDSRTTAPPKIGNRFSSESLKILRTWFIAHEDNPYPEAQDVEQLQTQTGLSRQQVATWFANARRRSKVSISSGRHSPFPRERDPLPVPPRRPTPAPFEHMNPLQRWENSPPEHEAAAFSDISRAVAAFSEPTGRSLSNGSSATTSASSRGSGSCSDAYSNRSRDSLGSGFRLKQRHIRRRRRAVKHQETARFSLIQAQNTYQCTFCTETFKTKYDWQRHEKSLHLSLEKWVCSPNGPTMVHPDTGLLVCVFCGLDVPDRAHLDGHNQSACIQLPLEERTYHRKDHLQQHLKLVHSANFQKWPMELWKMVSQNIQSRCGFCDARLSTWSSRADHLADHFKAGCTMADWQGDWGFDNQVLDRIDNAMPPYLIHYERNSPLPFAATKGPPDTPTSAYELIKLELEYHIRNQLNAHGTMPLDSELHFEACSVILGAEITTTAPSSPSWLWDIFMSSTDLANSARLRPTRQLVESRLSQLKINGKGNIFENCELEASLKRYMDLQAALGHSPSNTELQQEACNTLSRVEMSSPNSSKRFVEFLMRLVWRGTEWLKPLRERGPLFTNGYQAVISPGSFGLDPPIHNSYPPESPWMNVDSTPALDLTGPTTSPWLTSIGQGAALNPALLSTIDGMTNAATASGPNLPLLGGNQNFLEGTDQTAAPNSARLRQGTPFFINDNNSYRRLKCELSRFLKTTMSPNNPNRHVPTDEELKYQARWILYDDDDPWNQTPVDNEEWLREFKRYVGLSNPDQDEVAKANLA